MAEIDFNIELDSRSVDTIYRTMQEAAVGVAPTMTDADPADPANLIFASVTAEQRGMQLALNLFRRKERERFYKLHGGGVRAATKAKVSLVFTTTEGRDTGVLIDERVRVANDDGDIVYQVTRANPVTIPPGDTGDETDPNGRFVYLVEAEALDAGSDARVTAGAIVKVLNAPAGVTGVFNPYRSTGGEDEETLDEAELRLAKQFTSAGNIVRFSDFENAARLSNSELNAGKVRVLPLFKVQPMKVILTVRRVPVQGRLDAMTVAPGLIVSDGDGKRTYTIPTSIMFAAGQTTVAGVVAFARSERLSFAVGANELHKIVNNNFPGADSLSFEHGPSDPAPSGAKDAQGNPLRDYWRFLQYDPEGTRNFDDQGRPIGATLEPDGHVTVMVIPSDGGVAEEQHLIDVEFAYGGSSYRTSRVLPGMMHTGIPGQRQVHVIGHKPRSIKPRVEVYKRRDVPTDLVVSQVSAAIDAFLNPVTGGPKDLDGKSLGWDGGAEILPFDFYDAIRSVPSVTRIRSLTLPGETLNLSGAVALAFYEYPAPPTPDYTGRKYDITVSLDPSEQ